MSLARTQCYLLCLILSEVIPTLTPTTQSASFSSSGRITRSTLPSSVSSSSSLSSSSSSPTTPSLSPSEQQDQPTTEHGDDARHERPVIMLPDVVVGHQINNDTVARKKHFERALVLMHKLKPP